MVRCGSVDMFSPLWLAVENQQQLSRAHNQNERMNSVLFPYPLIPLIRTSPTLIATNYF
jgi:hypothetical protein